MKLRVAMVACGFVALAALVLAVPLFFPSPSDGSPTFLRNEAGLTYGSALNMSEEAAPDLILVEATNGKEGYVYKEDLDKASGAYVSTLEEAAAYEAERSERARNALVATVGEMVESGTLDEAKGNAREALSDLKDDADPEQQLAWVCNRLGLSEAQRSILASELDSAVANAIPVYEKDGKTLVGEFQVGVTYSEDYASAPEMF